MLQEDELYDLAELFKVFGDSTRIRILFVLFKSFFIVLSLFFFLYYISAYGGSYYTEVKYYKYEYE